MTRAMTAATRRIKRATADLLRPQRHVGDLLGVDAAGADFVLGSDGARTCAWQIASQDFRDERTLAAWRRFLLALRFPASFLVRQHPPGFGELIDWFEKRRPSGLSLGVPAAVGDALTGWLKGLPGDGDALDREIYLLTGQDHAADAESLLVAAGWAVRPVSGDDLRRLWAGSVAGRSASSCYGMAPGDVAVPDCAPGVGSLRLGQRWVRVFEVDQWPRRLSPMFLESVFGLGFELDFILRLYPLNKAESLGFLNMKKLAFESQQIDLIKRGRLVPPEVEGGIGDADRMLEQLSRNEGGLFRVAASLALYCDTPEALEEAGRQVKIHFQGMQAGARPFRLRQGAAFARLMPRMQSPLGALHMVDQGTVERLFPFGPPRLNTGVGIPFGMDFRSRDVVVFDRFATGGFTAESNRLGVGEVRRNPHMTVLAPAGSGKSFAVKVLALRECSRGIPVYLIDPEGEYALLARQMGGRVFHPGRENSGVNPFQLIYQSVDQLALQVAGLVALLEMMLARRGPASGLETTLDYCLNRFYQQELAQATEPSPVLGNGGIFAFERFLRELAVSVVEAGTLADELAPFVTGSYRFLFAQEGDSALVQREEAPFTVFNLQALHDDMKAAATMLCCQTVWGLAMSVTRPRLMVVDECWTVLMSPSGAQALMTMVKRGRKYRLGLVTITQDIEDFLDGDSQAGLAGHAGLSLLANSADCFLLRQSPGAAELIQRKLALSDEQRVFLTQARVGEGLLLTDQGSFPVRVVATPAEYELIENDGWRRDAAG